MGHRPTAICAGEEDASDAVKGQEELGRYGARALFDEFSISIKDTRRMKWLVASNSWAANSMINETGYSASQWVLGKN